METIKENYVSFETAKLLSTKGFKGEFHKHYWAYEPGKEFLTDGCTNPDYDYPAPTLQTAMKWLREKKHIFVEVSVDTAIKNAFAWRLFEYPSLEIMPYDGWENSPEDAAEAAIKYCLTNLI